MSHLTLAFLGGLIVSLLASYLPNILNGEGATVLQSAAHKVNASHSSQAFPRGGQWSVERHLGSISPWFPRQRDVLEQGVDPPAGCYVDQVHMLMRHGERYPGRRSGILMLELYHKLKASNVTFQGDLAFINDWEFLTLDPSRDFDQLLTTGPHAGSLRAFTTGTQLRTRYADLLKGAISRGLTKYWATDSKRVIDTAKYFASGFFGLDHQQHSTLHIVPKDPKLAANVLTTSATCPNFKSRDRSRGAEYGTSMLDKYRSIYTPAIVERLSKANPEFVFTEKDVYTMQYMCGFETLNKGRSNWCRIFTESEMEEFDYARDVQHFYGQGPGNVYAKTLGWPWLRATADLLKSGSPKGPFFFSFVHAEDIIPVLTALDFDIERSYLPVTHMVSNRTWRSSNIIPMGGRIILERLVCRDGVSCWSEEPLYPNHIYCKHNNLDEIYVRLNINDGIVAIPDCKSGPGQSCPLETFQNRIVETGQNMPSFSDMCGTPKDLPSAIEFLRQDYES